MQPMKPYVVALLTVQVAVFMDHADVPEHEHRATGRCTVVAAWIVAAGGQLADDRHAGQPAEVGGCMQLQHCAGRFAQVEADAAGLVTGQHWLQVPSAAASSLVLAASC